MRSFLYLISLFSVLSVSLLFTAWYASGIAPDLMSRNYRSIQYASQMEGALVAIFLAEVNGKVAPPAEVDRFEKNLQLEKENFTEENEEQIVQSLSKEWTAFRAKQVSSSIESFQSVLSTIKGVVDVNEKAMHAFEKKAVSLRYGVLFGGVLGFALVLLYALEIVLHSGLDNDVRR